MGVRLLGPGAAVAAAAAVSLLLSPVETRPFSLFIGPPGKLVRLVFRRLP